MNSSDNEYSGKGYKESVKHKELTPFLHLAANKQTINHKLTRQTTRTGFMANKI